MSRRKWKDLTVVGAALLAFPLVVNVPAWNAGGEGPSVEDPLWDRGRDTPVGTAGR